MDCRQLSDLDLLRVVLGKRSAERHYRGSLGPLFGASPSAHRKLVASHELVKRWLLEDLNGRKIFKEPRAVRDYLTALYAGMEHECFSALYLDNQHRLITADELSRGTIDGASVYPREVLKAVMRANAAAVIFAHNHPSGVAEPSAADGGSRIN